MYSGVRQHSTPLSWSQSGSFSIIRQKHSGNASHNTSVTALIIKAFILFLVDPAWTGLIGLNLE